MLSIAALSWCLTWTALGLCFTAEVCDCRTTPLQRMQGVLMHGVWSSHAPMVRRMYCKYCQMRMCIPATVRTEQRMLCEQRCALGLVSEPGVCVAGLMHGAADALGHCMQLRWCIACVQLVLCVRLHRAADALHMVQWLRYGLCSGCPAHGPAGHAHMHQVPCAWCSRSAATDATARMVHRVYYVR